MKENFAVAYGEDESSLRPETPIKSPRTGRESNGESSKKSNEEKLTPEEKHYKKLKRIASCQAHLLIKSYAKRPPWNFYVWLQFVYQAIFQRWVQCGDNDNNNN